MTTAYILVQEEFMNGSQINAVERSIEECALTDGIAELGLIFAEWRDEWNVTIYYIDDDGVHHMSPDFYMGVWDL